MRLGLKKKLKEKLHMYLLIRNGSRILETYVGEYNYIIVMLE